MSEENRIVQSSLADGGLSEEEKRRQAQKAEMQRRYRIISVFLVGVIIISALIYLFTSQKCLVLGHKWQAATCTEPRVCALCSAADGVALGHSWPTTDKLANCVVCGQPNGKLVNIGSDSLVSFWSDQTLDFTLQNGRQSNPTILETTNAIEACYSLTLCLRIDQLSAGNVFGEWGFYIRDLNGQWYLADTFILDGNYVEARLEFDEPISFDAWACPCHVLGDSWNFSFSVWLENATVFEYTG